MQKDTDVIEVRDYKDSGGRHYKSLIKVIYFDIWARFLFPDSAEVESI